LNPFVLPQSGMTLSCHEKGGNGVALRTLLRLRSRCGKHILEMEMRKAILGAAAAAMILGSSVAQAAPISDARVGSPVSEAEGFGGPEIWLGVLAAGLLIFILFQINDNEDVDLPTSP
jgi:hypothetical protein